MKTQSTIKIINCIESDKMAFAQLFFATPPRHLLPQSHASMLSQLGNKLRLVWFVRLSCRSPNSTRPTRPTSYEEVSDFQTISTFDVQIKICRHVDMV